MHEISLCLSTMELIEQQARQHGARRVTAVWLEIGALSCIEEHALRFSFASASRQTLAEGCQLHLSYQPAHAWCWDCSTRVAVERHDAGCPHCGGHALRIENGESLRLKQLEVE
ncbi:MULTISPECIES: hydrogenase maturation nickel metallochaperone HypA [unclassified Serratia (in: enterobacteria)]|uniref:hydrogenase maturation nickel metallochaperone HypA n=1 Tax=unclassified Serratia (in: enterobacteria) TaxID=2647522 RepID=UPI0005002AEC|nr:MULTISPECIES: hydrogenase maturation nickel metallochaperone HypA [unclassified Serratia (in: enterobacteria)]KFK96424.1 hydrogenase nickel incorporation protein [Serratia sp. Ag2]KFK99899.1 hydrogenase nickel incorporation protein [Serratia sp. Ag1]